MDAASAALGREVWVKVEEGAGAWGGNKVRKLEHLLADARSREATRLIACGAGSSSWAAAVAFHGTQHGFEVTVGLAGTAFVDLLDFYDRLGVTTMRAPRLEMLPLLVARARLTSGALALPAGGSGGIGDLGSMRAGLELADAMTAKEMPPVARVFAATGSAGTSAGLAVGLGLRGARVPVAAVRVTPRPVGTAWLVRSRIRGLRRSIGALGGPRDFIAAPVEGIGNHAAPGYGRPSGAAMDAIALAAEDGLVLDVGYAAKAFAALIGHAQQSGPGDALAFLHTSPGPLPAVP
jgi:D-cysteine desulfhydrase